MRETPLNAAISPTSPGNRTPPQQTTQKLKTRKQLRTGLNTGHTPRNHWNNLAKRPRIQLIWRKGAEMKDKFPTASRTNETGGAPLAQKVALTTRRDKTLEEQREVETQTGFESGEKGKSSRSRGPKTTIIPLGPNQKFE